MPTISVIVPVYKVEPYLRRCVDSILNQTFTDFELILVDDGSPDNCGAICDEYKEKDSRVRVIHKKNGGVSSARNMGLDVCEGQYVTFVDSDDYISADWLESLYCALMNSSADVVSADFTRVADGGKILGITLHQKIDEEIPDTKEKITFLLRKVLGGELGWEVSTRLFRADMIQDNHIRFCETCENYAEDLCFTLEYMLYVRYVATCNSAGYYYYQRSGSMMDQSRGKIRLNAVNEVSRQVSKRYFTLFHSYSTRAFFRVIHFQIMYGEYIRLIRSKREKEWMQEIWKIKRKVFFYRHTLSAPFSYRLFKVYQGRGYARMAILYSGFSIPGVQILYNTIHNNSQK